MERNPSYKGRNPMQHENDCRDRFAFPCCKFSRRSMLVGAGAVAAAALGWPLLRKFFPAKAPVFLARNQRYNGPLAETIAAGLDAVGFDKDWVRGRRVLLKPNLVEPTRPRRKSRRIPPSCSPRPRFFAAGAPRLRSVKARATSATRRWPWRSPAWTRP